MDFRRIASVSAIALGIVLVLGGIGTWTVVSSTLADQNITTPEDAWLAERQVRGPFTATPRPTSSSSTRSSRPGARPTPSWIVTTRCATPR